METTKQTAASISSPQSLISTLAVGAALVGQLFATPALSPQAQASTPGSHRSADLLQEAHRLRLHAIRLYHARELLGREYRTSLVRKTESVKDVETFVLQTVQKSLPSEWRKSASRVAQAVLSQSIQHGFDPIFVLSVIMTESSFRPSMIGGVGEIGLMQVRPETAEWLAKKISYTRYKGRASLFDPVVNIELGTAYFAMLRESFDDDGILYISAYNMGSKNVRRIVASSKRPKEYSGRVLGRYRELYKRFAPSPAVTRVAMN
jgi:soluble lytic murein transglycosylase